MYKKVQSHTHRSDVYLPSLDEFLRKYFRRQVELSPRFVLCHRVALAHLRNPKVCQFNIIVLVDQNIPGFDVSVYDIHHIMY